MPMFVPGEARLSEKCSLYRILEHVDDDSFRPYVRLSQQGYQNGREVSSRTVFVLSGDLILPNDNRKKRATARFHDGIVSKMSLKQHHEIDILAQESLILEIWTEPIYTGLDAAPGRAPWANLVIIWTRENRKHTFFFG